MLSISRHIKMEISIFFKWLIFRMKTSFLLFTFSLFFSHIFSFFLYKLIWFTLKNNVSLHGKIQNLSPFPHEFFQIPFSVYSSLVSLLWPAHNKYNILRDLIDHFNLFLFVINLLVMKQVLFCMSILNGNNFTDLSNF